LLPADVFAEETTDYLAESSDVDDPLWPERASITEPSRVGIRRSRDDEPSFESNSPELEDLEELLEVLATNRRIPLLASEQA
jgi:hypothetical protein